MFSYTQISPPEIILLSAAIAIFLSDGLNSDEQSFLGNLLMTIGQNITTISAQTQSIEDAIEKRNTDTADANKDKQI